MCTCKSPRGDTGGLSCPVYHQRLVKSNYMGLFLGIPPVRTPRGGGGVLSRDQIIRTNFLSICSKIADKVWYYIHLHNTHNSSFSHPPPPPWGLIRECVLRIPIVS